MDARSQVDTQYALVENAGVKLRRLETKDIEPFPSSVEETLQAKRQEAVAVAQGYAGTAFAIANPEAAIKILWQRPADEAHRQRGDRAQG